MQYSDSNFLKNTTDFGTSASAFVANMQTGGQLGLGINALTLDASTPLQFPPAMIFVLQTPTMYDDDMKEMGKMIKALMETHAKGWTGIDVETTLNTADSLVGNDSQNLQVPAKHVRVQPSPNATYDEVQGNLVWDLHHKWMNDIQDADTNGAMMGMNGNNVTNRPYTMSSYSATLLVIQPDITLRAERIIGAHIICNVFPTAPGPLGVQRQIGTVEVKERSVQYTGLLLHTAAIREIAVEMLKSLNLHMVNYQKDGRSVSAVTDYIADQGLTNDLSQAIANDISSGTSTLGSPA